MLVRAGVVHIRLVARHEKDLGLVPLAPSADIANSPVPELFEAGEQQTAQMKPDVFMNH